MPAAGRRLAWEVLATYLAMTASTISLRHDLRQRQQLLYRTIAALVVSYLVILPLALVVILFYSACEGADAAGDGGRRVSAVPGGRVLALAATSRRLLHPPDVGAEAKEVVDPDLEQRTAMGTGHSQRPVSRPPLRPPETHRPDGRPRQSGLRQGNAERDLRPGHAHAPAGDPVEHVPGPAADGGLPVHVAPLAPWYTCYVLLFNMLVGPVFSAGSDDQRARAADPRSAAGTTLSPWQILSAKLYSGLRISCVLTSFLVWPLLLSWLLPPWTYWQDSVTVINYLGIILLSSLTTTTVAMFCSVVLRKTSVSMMTTYLVLMVLYAVPVAAKVFADVFFQGGGARRPGCTPRSSTRPSPARWPRPSVCP